MTDEEKEPKQQEDWEIHWQKAQETLKEANLCFWKKHYNGCISRSYYAIYQTLATTLKKYGNFDEDSKEHEKVIYDFKRHHVKNGEKTFFKGEIEKWKSLRIDADYKSIMCNIDDTQKLLNIAKKFIKLNSKGIVEEYSIKEMLEGDK